MASHLGARRLTLREMAGEFDFIAWLRGQQGASPLVRVPAGDDLAVLDWPKEDLLIVGVDQVLDGVHFDSAVHSPRQIGAKVMNRNLSDCAAMACLPAAAVVSAALPKGTSLEYAKELYLGMKEAPPSVPYSNLTAVAFFSGPGFREKHRHGATVPLRPDFNRNSEGSINTPPELS